MTKGEDFIKRGKCKNTHCSPMSKSAWCDLNRKCNILKLHDKCPNAKCNCQKIVTFTPQHYMVEIGSIKKLQKIINGTQTAWNKFIKPGLKMVTPLISAAIAAKTKNPQSFRVANSILKSLTGGKVLSLTDMHGNGLRLKVM